MPGDRPVPSDAIGLAGRQTTSASWSSLCGSGHILVLLRRGCKTGERVDSQHGVKLMSTPHVVVLAGLAEQLNTRFRDGGAWNRLGLPPATYKVLVLAV